MPITFSGVSKWREIASSTWSSFEADPEGVIKNEALSHVVQGRRDREAGRLSPAVSHLRLAARLLPRSAVVQAELGDAELDRGQASAAQVAYQRALELDAGNEQASRGLELLERVDDGSGSQP